MQLNLLIKKIKGVVKTKDETEFYKVEFLDTWIPANLLQAKHENILKRFQHSLKLKENSEINLNNQDVCAICGETLDEKVDKTFHEEEHVSSCDTSGEVLGCFNEKLTNQPYLSVHTFTNSLNPMSIQTPDTLVQSHTNQEEHKPGEHISRANMPTCSLKDTTLENDCNENDTIAHVQKAEPYYNCTQCNKLFVSKQLFDKHVTLHSNSNRLHQYYDRLRRSKNCHAAKKQLYKFYLRDGTCTAFHTAVNDESKIKNDKNLLVYPRPNIKKPKKFRGWCQEMEFTPEVLKNAKRYIKSVSMLRKRKSLARNRKGPPHAAATSLFENIGVDFELKETEESLPVVSVDSVGKTSYSCKVCRRTFFNKFHHREHFNTHSGETPYECEFCNKQFAQRSGWNRHIKLHHKYEVFSGPLSRDMLANQKSTHASFADVAPPNRYLSSTNVLPLQNMMKDKQTLARCRTPKPSVNESHYPTQPSTPGVQVMLSPSLPSSASQCSPNDFFTKPRYIGATPTPSLPSGAPLSALDKVNEFLSTCLDGGVLKENMSKFINVGDKDTTVKVVKELTSNLLTAENNPSIKEFTSVNGVSTNIPAAPTTTADVSDGTAGNGYKYMFQCKKVQTMNGDVIFMVRLAGSTEYAYILDIHGLVKSRIFVDESPGSAEWLEFPLDETTDSVLLKRVQSYDLLNKRGQKPGPSSFKFTSKFNIYNIEKSAQVPFYDDNITTLENDDDIGDVEDEIDDQEPTNVGRKCKSGRVKKFSCPICSRKFLAQAHVNSHMLIHTGEFPYKCMFCGRPFRHKSGLNSHHKRHFQRGIFNQPICGSKTYKAHTSNAKKNKNTDQLTVRKYNRKYKTSSLQSTPQEPSVPKRKGRPPKHLSKQKKTSYKSQKGKRDSTSLHQHVVRNELKSYDTKLPERNESTIEMLDKSTFERNKFDELAMFECHFCSMKFTMRLAYLEHIESHNNNNNNANVSEDPQYIKFENFNEDSTRTATTDRSLFTNMKIKIEASED